MQAAPDRTGCIPTCRPTPGTNSAKHKEQALIGGEYKADFFVADTLWADEVSPPDRLDRFEATTLPAALAAKWFPSHRLHADHAAVLDAACEAWNRLYPGTLPALTSYSWLPKSVHSSAA